MPPARIRTIASILLILYALPPVLGALQTAVIDDEYGDEYSGVKPLFVPSTPGVWEGEECGGCLLKPDVTRVFRSTYNAATYRNLTGETQRVPREVRFQFTGIAVTVFLTLANAADAGVTTLTEAVLIVDDREPVPFRHAPNPSTRDFVYQYPAWNVENLEHRAHTVVVRADGPVTYDTYINFDYARYTYDDAIFNPNPRPPSTTTSTPSSSPSQSPGITNSASEGDQKSLAGPIAGGVIGGLAIFVIFLLALFFVRRRSRRAANPHGAPKEYPSPEVFAFTGHLNSGSSAPPSTNAASSLGASMPTRYGHHHGASTAYTTTTATTTTDRSSGYMPPSTHAAQPYGYRPSGYAPADSATSLGGGVVLGGGGVGARSTESGASTSKRELARRERERELMMANAAGDRRGVEGASAQDEARGFEPVRKYRSPASPGGAPPSYPPQPLQYATTSPTSRSDSPFDPSSLYSTAAATQGSSQQRPRMDTSGSAAGASTVRGRVAALQRSIQAVVDSIQAEEDEMARSGMSDNEISADAGLNAMKASLRVMQDQMIGLQRSAGAGAREDLPEYESPTEDQPGAGRRSMSKR